MNAARLLGALVSASPPSRDVASNTASLIRPGECNRGPADGNRYSDHRAAVFHRALGVFLSQGNSFPMADPHTSTISTVVWCGPYTICIRKSLQFRAFAAARQVLTPSMPRMLCRLFFDG